MIIVIVLEMRENRIFYKLISHKNVNKIIVVSI